MKMTDDWDPFFTTVLAPADTSKKKRMPGQARPERAQVPMKINIDYTPTTRGFRQKSTPAVRGLFSRTHARTQHHAGGGDVSRVLRKRLRRPYCTICNDSLSLLERAIPMSEFYNRVVMLTPGPVRRSRPSDRVKRESRSREGMEIARGSDRVSGLHQRMIRIYVCINATAKYGNDPHRRGVVDENPNCRGIFPCNGRESVYPKESCFLFRRCWIPSAGFLVIITVRHRYQSVTVPSPSRDIQCVSIVAFPSDHPHHHHEIRSRRVLVRMDRRASADHVVASGIAGDGLRIGHNNTQITGPPYPDDRTSSTHRALHGVDGDDSGSSPRPRVARTTHYEIQVDAPSMDTQDAQGVRIGHRHLCTHVCHEFHRQSPLYTDQTVDAQDRPPTLRRFS